MKRPSLPFRAGAIALTLLVPAMVSSPPVSAERHAVGAAQTLSIDLDAFPDGQIPVDGFAVNSFTTLSAPEGSFAAIVSGDSQFPNGAINLAPGRVWLDFEPGDIEVRSVSYEVFNNNSTSFGAANGSGGSWFVIHPNELSTQVVDDIGAIRRVELDGLEAFVTNIVIEFTGAGPDDDSDGDGFTDGVDNCTLVANPSQLDADGDLFGNACDADLNNDNVVNFLDLGLFRDAFTAGGSGDGDGDGVSVADFDGDGDVDFADLGTMRQAFFGTPGPAAPA